MTSLVQSGEGSKPSKMREPAIQSESFPRWIKIKLGVPNGSRTHVSGLKGRRPRPLDDRDGR